MISLQDGATTFHTAALFLSISLRFTQQAKVAPNLFASNVNQMCYLRGCVNKPNETDISILIWTSLHVVLTPVSIYISKTRPGDHHLKRQIGIYRLLRQFTSTCVIISCYREGKMEDSSDGGFQWKDREVVNLKHLWRCCCTGKIEYRSCSTFEEILKGMAERGPRRTWL